MDPINSTSNKLSGSSQEPRYGSDALPTEPEPTVVPAGAGATPLARSIHAAPLPLPLAATTRRVPILFRPEADITALISILRTMQRELTNADMAFSLGNAQHLNDALASQQDKSLSAQTRIDRGEVEIAGTSSKQKIGGWLMAALGVVLGIVAVFTAGTALALGLAIFGFFMAAWNLAGTITSEIPSLKRVNIFGETVPADVSLNGIIRILCEKSAQDNNIKVAGVNGNKEGAPGVLSRQQFENHVAGWTIGITFAIVIVTAFASGVSIFKGVGTAAKAAAGAAEASEAAEAINVFQKSSQTLDQLKLSIISQSGNLVTALGQIVNVVFSAILISDRNSLAILKITKEEIDGTITILQSQFEQSNQGFKAAMDYHERLRNYVGSAMADYIEQLNKISKNC